MAKQEFRVALAAAIPFSMEASGLLAGIGQILAKAQDEIRKKHGVEMQLTQGVVTLRQPKGAKPTALAAMSPELAAAVVQHIEGGPEPDEMTGKAFGGPGQEPTPSPEPQPQPEPQPTAAPAPQASPVNTAAPPPKSFAEMAAEAKARREAGQAG